MNIQKPTYIHIIAWTTLASGIVNLFWGFAASSTALATLIGVLCVPITILPTILGVFELIYAAKLFSNPAQPIKPSTNIAILEIATILTANVFSMAVGILSLIFYNDVIVKDYFARLNGTITPTSVTPPALISLPDLEPAPVISEPIQNEIEESPLNEETPSAPVDEAPAPPKRAPRKVAKK